MVFSWDVITFLIQSDEEEVKAWEPAYFQKLYEQRCSAAGLILVIRVKRNPSTGKFGFGVESKRHIIRGVVKDSYAHKQGLRNGGILLDVEGVTITTTAEIKQAIKGQTTIVLKIGTILLKRGKCEFCNSRKKYLREQKIRFNDFEYLREQIIGFEYSSLLFFSKRIYEHRNYSWGGLFFIHQM